MTAFRQFGRHGVRTRYSGKVKPVALSQAEEELNIAIASYGIDSGEVFVAQLYLNDLQRRWRHRR